MAYTFAESKFNQDISGWDISRVETFNWMFDGAAQFSQDLCAWGGKITDPYPDNLNIVYSQTFQTFAGTACPTTDDPDTDASPPGPFCYPCA